MSPRDPLAAFGKPVALDLAREPKPYHGSDRRSTADGPPHPDSGAIGRMIALHLAQGEWRRAEAVLKAALEDVKASAVHADPRADPSLAELGLDPRVCNLLEKRGILCASDVRKLTDDELLEVPNIGTTTVVAIRTAVAALTAKRKAG